MVTPFFSAIVSIRSWFRSRAALQVEILALRHQLSVLKRSQRRRLRLNSSDRLLWVWLSRLWSQWRSALLIVKPETVVAWQRRGFRCYWRWKSRNREPGRPTIDLEIRELIRKMSLANPLWEHRGSMGNCSNSVSKCAKLQWRSTWLVSEDRPPRLGVLS